MYPINITEELRKLQSYGFSRKEAIEDLQAKGVRQAIIDRNIDLYFKPISDVNRKSFLFWLTIFLLAAISSTPLFAVVHNGDYEWLFVTLFLLAMTFGVYRLWNFSLWAWAIVLGFVLAILFLFLSLCLVHPNHGGLPTWDYVGLLVFASMLLRRVIDIMTKRLRFLKEAG